MDLLLDIYGLLSVVLNGLLLSAQAVALGGVGFLLLLADPLAPSLGEGGRRMSARCRLMLRASAIAVISLVVLIVTSEVVVLADTIDIPLIDALQASFVAAGAGQIVAATALLAVRLRDAGANRVGMATAALVLLVSATATSHAIAQPGDQTLLAIFTALHQLGAAAWIGGIPYFLIALAACHGSDAWQRIGRRFYASQW